MTKFNIGTDLVLVPIKKKNQNEKYLIERPDLLGLNL